MSVHDKFLLSFFSTNTGILIAVTHPTTDVKVKRCIVFSKKLLLKALYAVLPRISVHALMNVQRN